MDKKIKLKILRRVLKRKGYNFEYLESFDDLADRVDEDPTSFIETCIEEAYNEGIKLSNILFKKIEKRKSRESKGGQWR